MNLSLCQNIMMELQASPDPAMTIDGIELALMTCPEADTELRHAFTPGLYSRTFVMPGGSMVVSETHLTEHQFVVSTGECLVYNALDNSVERITAPHHGVTKPGTRRVILVFEDTTWTTFHANPENESDPDKIKARIVKQRLSPPQP